MKYGFSGASWFFHLWERVVALLGSAVFVVVGALMLWHAPWSLDADYFVAALLFAAAALFGGVFAALVLTNLHPSVWAGPEGLWVSFMFGRIFVAWKDIWELRPKSMGSYLVSARRITGFHRIYGLVYGATLTPSFLISRWLDDRDELVREILRKSPARFLG